MEQNYIDYLRIGGDFTWPDQIRQKFDIVQHDNIFLEPGSQKEKEFLDLCVELEIVTFISKYGVWLLEEGCRQQLSLLLGCQNQFRLSKS